MAINYEQFIHKSDAAALKTLKAIPGFTPALKGFMKVFNERYIKILNLAECIRVNDSQYKKYFDMLVSICKRLDLNVPELYIEHDPYPNAYTMGENNPCIVITSGLFETVPDELIYTAIAHECGHILCHHVLYTTMADMIFSSAENILAHVTSFALSPLRIPFYYWMRCSEFSADRVAIVCDGSPEHTIELNMCLAGCDKDILGEPSKDEFMKQAIDYEELLKDDKISKVMEMLYMLDKDHPLSSVRAYEAKKWAQTDEFKKTLSEVK